MIHADESIIIFGLYVPVCILKTAICISNPGNRPNPRMRFNLQMR